MRRQPQLKAKGTLWRPEFTGDMIPPRNGTKNELALWTPSGNHLGILRKYGLERGSTVNSHILPGEPRPHPQAVLAIFKGLILLKPTKIITFPSFCQ